MESADYLTVAPAVVRVAPDAPVGDIDDRLPHVVADADGLVALAERWGLVVEREARGGRSRAGLTSSPARVNCAERVEVGRIRHGRLSSCCDVVTDR